MNANTLASLKAGGYRLVAYCNERHCGHAAELDLDVLIAALGAGARYKGPRFRAGGHLKCSKCGSADVTVTHHAPSGYEKGQVGGKWGV